MGNHMAVSFSSDIETIKNNYNARLRTAEPFSKIIVAADMNALRVNHQAEIANIAGLEKMVGSGMRIESFTNTPGVSRFVNNFNALFSLAEPKRDGPART